ncbi:MAG: hypothetical protein IKO05_09180 [Selenomonadaceae bacterium]|nr:hypothetical protein [Selenomonadaceae bacterium]
MIKALRNERGFLLLDVVLLTLITSFAAVVLLNAHPQAKNPHSTLKLTALHLADEQLAYLESFGDSGELQADSYPFLGESEDLVTENFSDEIPIEFSVTTRVDELGGNLYRAVVTVGWQAEGKDFEIESERTIRFVPK